MIPYKLRPPKETDSSFIFNSWLKSYRSSDFAKTQCNAVYFENHKKVIAGILENSLITVVCSPDDEDHLYGYCVYQKIPGNNLLIHYLYIKHTYRRMQLAKKLIHAIRSSENPILASHYTNACKHVKSTVILYDPYKMVDNNFEIE